MYLIPNKTMPDFRRGLDVLALRWGNFNARVFKRREGNGSW